MQVDLSPPEIIGKTKHMHLLRKRFHNFPFSNDLVITAKEEIILLLNYISFWSNVSQSMVKLVLNCLSCVLKMYIFGLCPRPTESESLELAPKNLYVRSSLVGSGWFRCTVRSTDCPRLSVSKASSSRKAKLTVNLESMWATKAWGWGTKSLSMTKTPQNWGHEPE